jgi:Trypsin
MTMKAAKAVLACLVAVLAAPAIAITGTNWVEDNEHPFVGLIVFYDQDGEFLHRCSGSLISPTVFVTAGHCVEGATTARVYFQQDAGANFNPATGIDPITGYPETCAPGTLGTLCATSDELYDFADFTDSPADDVAVVILDQPIALAEYGQLPTANVLLTIARGTANTLFTVSGYGLTKRWPEQTGKPFISFRERLMGLSTFVNLNNTGGFYVQTQGNGNGRSGTCSGDSGGPVFLGGFTSNVIVGVTSFGLNALCRGTDFAFRIDTPEVLAWISSFL